MQKQPRQSSSCLQVATCTAMVLQILVGATNTSVCQQGHYNVDTEDAEVLLQKRLTVESDPNTTIGDVEGEGEVIMENVHKIENTSAAQEVASQAFDTYDKDGSGELDAEELHHGLFSDAEMHKVGKPVNSSAVRIRKTSAALDLTSARHIISIYDGDASGALNKTEFMAATAQKSNSGGASLLQRRGVDKCVVDIFGSVWDSHGCVESFEWSECSDWNFFVCVGKATYQGTRVVGCWVERVVDSAVSSFSDCLRQVIDAVKSAASTASKGFMDLLPDDCSSGLDSCKDKLLEGPKKLLDVVGDKLQEQVLSKLGPLQDGVKMLGHIATKAAPVMKDVGDVVVRAGKAIANFVISSGLEIAKYASNLPDLCSPSGVGFWYISPTDCGAFGSMKKIFSESFQVWKVKGNFDDTVSAFGRCIVKTGVLSLPSPFMDIKVQGFCLPDFIQKPIKGIVGSFQYFVAQTRAVANGCSGLSSTQSSTSVSVTISGYGTPILQNPIPCGSGEIVASQSAAYSTSSDCEARDKCVIETSSSCQVRVWRRDRCASVRSNYQWSAWTSSTASSGGCTVQLATASTGPQPVCQLAKDISDIGAKITTLFNPGSLLIQAAAHAATNSSEDGKVYRADCSGSDFSVNIDFGIGVVFPLPSGGMMKPFLFFQAMSGCRKKSPFVDISFGLGLDRGVLGAPKEIKNEGFIKLGFSIGTPGAKVFNVGAAIKLALAVDLKSIGIPLNVGRVFAFGILPKITYPKGFTTVFKGGISASLLQAKGGTSMGRMASTVQKAIDDTEGYDEKVYAAYAAFARELANADLPAAFREAVPEPHALMQHSMEAVKRHVVESDMLDVPIKPNCLASLAFRFCLTCLPEVKDVMKDTIPGLKSVNVPQVKVGYMDYPDCEPGCLNGHNQLKGEVYRVSGKCYQALDECWGCLGNPPQHPGSLISVPCKLVHIYPACLSQQPSCMTGGTHLRPLDIYRISGACWQALDNCLGCIGSPASHPSSMRSIPCPDAAITAYDYPSCSSQCLLGGKHQIVGVTYKVSGTCWRATAGCWGCLNSPASYTDALAEVPCP